MPQTSVATQRGRRRSSIRRGTRASKSSSSFGSPTSRRAAVQPRCGRGSPSPGGGDTSVTEKRQRSRYLPAAMSSASLHTAEARQKPSLLESEQNTWFYHGAALLTSHRKSSPWMIRNSCNSPRVKRWKFGPARTTNRYTKSIAESATRASIKWLTM
jgi:hypothetical protein